MVATLTSQLAEFFEEGAERVYESLEKVLGRVEKVRQTVEGAEIYEVIRRRLFEDLGDEAQHRATVEAFWKMNQQLGEDVPAACREPSYRDEMLRAYPFHPELIDTPVRAVGDDPRVPADPWRAAAAGRRDQRPLPVQGQRAPDPERVDQPGPRRRSVASWSSTPGRRRVYLSVIDSDIAGRNAKAPEIDRQLGSEYAKESVSEKLARAAFMYSFSGGQQRGATLPQLRLAVLNPEMAPPFVSDALDRMTKRLWYLYHDNGLSLLRQPPEPEPHPGGPGGTGPLGAREGAGVRQEDAQRPDRGRRLPGLPLPR